MAKVIEVIYENGVFKPLQKVDLPEGAIVRIRIEKRVDIQPIKLKRPISIERIKEIRDELWMSI